MFKNTQQIISLQNYYMYTYTQKIHIYNIYNQCVFTHMQAYNLHIHAYQPFNNIQTKYFFFQVRQPLRKVNFPGNYSIFSFQCIVLLIPANFPDVIVYCYLVMNRQGVSLDHNITYESIFNDIESASLVYNLKQSEKDMGKKIRDNLFKILIGDFSGISTIK